MASWQQLCDEAPELARAVRARFEAHKHHVLATVRADGSPRVSGTEVDFRGTDVYMGSMPGARKARDLQRDGRFALHANPGDGSMEGGDAKLAGVAVEVPGEGQRTGEGDQGGGGGEEEEEAAQAEAAHTFRLDLREAVLTSVHPDRDRLVIETWRPGGPQGRIERA